MVKKYIPKQGDVIYIDFNPTKGHEQRESRPAIVISNNVFNVNTKMVIVCPVSTNEKYFPTHYHIENTNKIYVFVLYEYIRSIGYTFRNIVFIEN